VEPDSFPAGGFVQAHWYGNHSESKPSPPD
jgi:hypothetical protein